MKNTLLSLVAFTLLIGCSSPQNKTKTFKTSLPCADCDEIVSVLVLDDNGSFSLSDTYVKDTNQTFTKNGVYSVEGDIIIIPSDDETLRFKKDGENLNRLDFEGNLVEGEFRDNYNYKLSK
ncbi:copper homeostasis protein CutF [Campylobacter hyointestinalis subsp. hyointestinalis]|uniref:Copper homeostasis protein CutF n=1 Tax=Campylobacter hyointestinalis subsp. hyointestinalis TaxID=91352 RepID=A0A0S4RAF4_CAMHY|nr:copper resistance protein NlpE N-terminal domain-containing protein [Campylobacter hyointestinalis]PPB52260.1 copper resistance protein NlpE [Campylobacter hyointestinalis subsp. hyointestinalis]PPB52631.1 copper resistance protein NlpE [Campylobacter hyointestinalis subsp. hyointestinalis]PPB60561.1 copper resistance protein NlpE [Campylobacter hyointestinalis subsp. hyointestinalis]PPB65229.1 copper resistance protein NlpE [Campylobacter hyointestinalis subsp. hyointestinalis]PPB67530.1 c